MLTGRRSAYFLKVFLKTCDTIKDKEVLNRERSTMLIRERTEELEKKLLSPKAAFSADAKRSREETEDPMRTKFSATGTVFSTAILSAG